MEKRLELSRCKRIIQISSPLIIQGVVFQLQSLTDKAFLGNLDTKYVSAAGTAQLPYNATADSLVAISIGITIIIARLFGANQRKEMRKSVQSGIFYNTVIGAICFLFWQCLSEKILLFFQLDPLLLKDSISYIKICTFYFLLIGIDSTLHGYLQGIGNTKPIMYSGLIKVGLDILFSWILIFGKLGFPAMYVQGAALGTLLANVISFLYILIYCMFFKNKEYGFRKAGVEWFDLRSYLRMFRLGIPSGAEFLLWNVSNLVLIRFINGFSYQSMAIYTLTFGCQCIVYVTFSATSKATLTVMGHLIGARREKEVDQTFFSCIFLNFLIVAIAALIFMFFPKVLLDIFSDDAQVINHGVPYLIFLAFIMFPQSMNVLCGNGIKAKGDTRWMLISQSIGSSVVVVTSYVLIEVFGLNMIAIYITLFMDESIRGLINFIHYRKLRYSYSIV